MFPFFLCQVTVRNVCRYIFRGQKQNEAKQERTGSPIGEAGEPTVTLQQIACWLA